MNGPSLDGGGAPRVSVCIATYRRNDRLRRLLQDLGRQRRLPDQVVVVDNDASGAARSVIEQCRADGIPFGIDYDVQPVPNIAVTRNRTIRLATGDWLAFIDDDERAPEDWLQQLLWAADAHRADGVLGPVEPQVPDSAPAWIRRGHFYDFAHQPEGAVIPLRYLRFGNVLLRAKSIEPGSEPFDPRHGLKSGEDTDMLAKLAHRGVKIVWTEKAPVFEPIEQSRLSLQWLGMRALAGGQGFASYTVSGGFGPISRKDQVIFFLRVVVQLVVAASAALLFLPAGRHRAAAWLIKAYANFGKLSVLWGWQYQPYARAP